MMTKDSIWTTQVIQDMWIDMFTVLNICNIIYETLMKMKNKDNIQNEMTIAGELKIGKPKVVWKAMH
jgi:hypothetical protein